MNLYTALQAAWAQPVDELAIVAGDESQELRYTWADLERATAMIANLLGGIQRSRRGGRGPPALLVAAHVDKSVEALMLYLATLRAGGVFMPLNPAYRAAELDYFLEDARPDVLVCRSKDMDWVTSLAAHRDVSHLFTLNDDRTGSLLLHAARQPDRHAVAERDDGDRAAILYTSGTTGQSKGALLTHGNLLSNARALLYQWDWRVDDVLVHALPIFHIHGLFVACHCALLSATPMRWLNKFDAPMVIRHLANEQHPHASVFMGVPTMYGRLLADAGLAREHARHMRLFISGSAPLSPLAFSAFTEITGHVILERYGMSETGMLCSNPCRTSEGPRQAGSVGRPLPGVELRLTDDAGLPINPTESDTGPAGHVEVRGRSVFTGYLRQPAKTAESFTSDGWFKTGDIGRLDPQGCLHLVGRARDLIISGGFNIYPAEIESHLDKLPGVLESAVIGAPHPDFGEGVVAVVVTPHGVALDEAEIIAILKNTIAGFKVPKRVFFVDDLPRNAMGKVQKNLLRQQHDKIFTQETP